MPEFRFGDFFKTVRVNQGIKQQTVAEAVGITHVALSRFESNRSRLSYETLSKIAPLLNVSSEFLADTSKNPFYSKKLIKMYLSAEFLEIKYSLLSLFHVMIHTQFVNIVFLIPPATVFDKIRWLNFDAEIPVYAILCKDIDGNVFLFRRKGASDFILKKDELETSINRMLSVLSRAKIKRRLISYKAKKINKQIYENIRNWSVSLDDVLPLFDDVDNAERVFQFAMSIDADIRDLRKVLARFRDDKSGK